MKTIQLRSVIVGALVACLGIAMAPWMSGGQQPMAMLVSGGALLLATLLVWRQPQVRRLKGGVLTGSFVALVGFGLLSLLWTVNTFSSVVWITQWTMAGLAFGVAYILAGEPKGRERVLRIYLFTAAVFSVAAIGMYMMSDYHRLTGTFYWANPAAAYLIPAVLLSIDRVWRTRRKVSVGWCGTSILFLSTFLLADSRAATLVLGLMLAVYLLVIGKNKLLWIKFVFIVILAVGLSFGLSQLSTMGVQQTNKVAPGSRFAEAAMGGSKSLSDRFYFLGSAFDMWFAHPLGGTGAGTYGDVHPQYQKRVISASTNAHNVYVQTLSELGMVGAMALAGVLLWLLVGMARGVMTQFETLPLGLAAGGLLVHFGLDIDAHYPALLILLAVLAGLIYRQWGPRMRDGLSWRWPMLAVLVMLPLVSLYQSNVWAERGQMAQEDEDYDRAVEYFDLAHGGLVYDPDLLNAAGINFYVLAANGSQGSRDLMERALERAQAAQALDSRDGQHYQLQGRVLAGKGDLKGAEQAFQKALERDPYNHPDYALDLASVQLRAGRTDEGVKTAQKMLALYPAEVINNRSNDITMRPALADLEALVGNIYLKSGKRAEAGAAAERALIIDKANLRARALKMQISKPPLAE